MKLKGKMKKIIGSITLFLIGAGTKTFAVEQTDLYGPPPEHLTNNTNVTPNFKIIATSIASIILFIIGLIVLLNKNISKKVKIITSVIIGILIIGLIVLRVCLG